jgi:hypothetical protein
MKIRPNVGASLVLPQALHTKRFQIGEPDRIGPLALIAIELLR